MELGADDVGHVQQLLNQFLAAAGLGEQLTVVPVNPGMIRGGMRTTSASSTDGAMGPVRSGASAESVKGAGAAALRDGGEVSVEGGLPNGARLRVSLALTQKDISRGVGVRGPWGPSHGAVVEHALALSGSDSDDEGAPAGRFTASVHNGDGTGGFNGCLYTDAVPGGFMPSECNDYGSGIFTHSMYSEDITGAFTHGVYDNGSTMCSPNMDDDYDTGGLGLWFLL